MEPIDQLRFSKRLKNPKGETTLFTEAASFIQLPQPPANSSLETGKDLLFIQGSTFLRTPGLEQSIKKHDKDPSYAIKKYLDLFGLEYDERYIGKVLEESAVLVKEQKNKFNRPRPIQIAPYYSVELPVVKSKTNKTPSYPSGHSTQSRLIAEIYAKKYPEHAKNLYKAADECGLGRISAGFHFKSDHKAGVYLGKRLFKALKSPQSQKPMKYDRVLKF
tara:strand:+ start:4843 stop:5499 length:657 start_codon:yes stop_codon:yes gene_type:complete